MRYYVNIPFKNKNLARSEFNTKWDKNNECWYVTSKEDKEKIKHLEQLPERKARATANAEDEFKEFLRVHGMDEPNPILDGNMHHCRLIESRGRQKKGSYAFYSDGIVPAGFCYNNKTQEKTIFKANGKGELESYKYDQAEIAQRNYDRFVGEQKKWIAVSKECFSIYKNAKEVPKDHKYLKNKGIEADPGVRFLEEHKIKFQSKDGEEKEFNFKNVLLIPSMASDGYIKSIQYIDENGRKVFHPGGQKSGCFKLIGDPKNAENIAICEGYATGKTIADNVPNTAVYCTFDCGNLVTVSEIVYHENYEKNKRLIVAADNDWHKDRKKNDGLEKAKKIKKIFYEYELAVPYFNENSKGTDWNDLWKEKGASCFDNFLSNNDNNNEIGLNEPITSEMLDEVYSLVDKYEEYLEKNNIEFTERIKEDVFNEWYELSVNHKDKSTLKEHVLYYYNVDWMFQNEENQKISLEENQHDETISNIASSSTAETLDDYYDELNHEGERKHVFDELLEQNQEEVNRLAASYKEDLERLGIPFEKRLDHDYYQSWFNKNAKEYPDLLPVVFHKYSLEWLNESNEIRAKKFTQAAKFSEDQKDSLDYDQLQRDIEVTYVDRVITALEDYDYYDYDHDINYQKEVDKDLELVKALKAYSDKKSLNELLETNKEKEFPERIKLLREITKPSLSIDEIVEKADNERKADVTELASRYMAYLESQKIANEDKTNVATFNKWFDSNCNEKELQSSTYYKFMVNWEKEYDKIKYENYSPEADKVKNQDRDARQIGINENVYHLSKMVHEYHLQEQYVGDRHDIMTEVIIAAESMYDRTEGQGNDNFVENDLGDELRTEYFNVVEKLKICSQSQYIVGTLKPKEAYSVSNSSESGSSLSNHFKAYSSLEDAIRESSKYPIANAIERITRHKDNPNEDVSVHCFSLDGKILDYEDHERIWESNQKETFEVVFIRQGDDSSKEVISQYPTLEQAVEACKISPKSTSIHHTYYKDNKVSEKLNEYLINGEKVTDEIKNERNKFMMKAYANQSGAKANDNEEYFYILKEKEYVASRLKAEENLKKELSEEVERVHQESDKGMSL